MRLGAPCLILLILKSFMKLVDVCTLDSGRCCHNYFKKDGDCKECPDGTFGTDCGSMCPSGFFGKFCRQECLCEAKDCNIVHGCSYTIGTPKSNFSMKTTPLIVESPPSPLPWISATFVFVGCTVVLTVVLALNFLKTWAIKSKQRCRNNGEPLVSYRINNREDVEEQGNPSEVLSAQHQHRQSTVVTQLLNRCSSYKVYKTSMAEETPSLVDAVLSKSLSEMNVLEIDSTCEQEGKRGYKIGDESSSNTRMYTDKSHIKQDHRPQYKTVDKAQKCPGSRLRPYSSIKYNRYTNNGLTPSQQRRFETVCEKNDLYDDAFSKIIGNEYEDIGSVNRSATSNYENETNNVNCFRESISSLTEEEEANISVKTDNACKHMAPLRKTDDEISGNIYTSLDLTKCNKLDANEYETQRSTLKENKSFHHEYTSEENKEECEDSCSNSTSSIEGNTSFAACYEEDVEKNGTGMRVYEDIT